MLCSSSRTATAILLSPLYPYADVGVSEGFGRGVHNAISSFHSPQAGFLIDASLRFQILCSSDSVHFEMGVCAVYNFFGLFCNSTVQSLLKQLPCCTFTGMVCPYL